MKSIKLEKVLAYEVNHCEGYGNRPNSIYSLELYASCIGMKNLIFDEVYDFKNYLNRNCYNRLLKIYNATHGNRTVLQNSFLDLAIP